MRRTIPSFLLVALACAACGSTSSSGSADLTPTPPSSSHSTEAGYAGPSIPDGTYRHVVTPVDVTRVGYPDFRTVSLLGKDRRDPIILKISGLRWSVFDDEGTGTGLGDLGTFEYGRAHLVSMISNSVGCPGCTQLWHWSAPGGSLTLVERKDIRDDAQNDPRDERLVLEHTFTKVG